MHETRSSRISIPGVVASLSPATLAGELTRFWEANLASPVRRVHRHFVVEGVGSGCRVCVGRVVCTNTQSEPASFFRLEPRARSDMLRSDCARATKGSGALWKKRAQRVARVSAAQRTRSHSLLYAFAPKLETTPRPQEGGP